MKTEDLKQYQPLIRNISLFSYLTADELDGITAITEIVNLRKDDVIIRQGEINPYFYGVLEGSVRVEFREKDGTELTVCTIGEREVFGESGIFLTGQRTANVISTGNTWVIKIHRNELLNYIKNNPQAGNKILMLVIYGLLKKLKDSNLELADLKKCEVDLDNMDGLVQEFMAD